MWLLNQPIVVYQWVAEKDNHNSCTRSRPFPVTSNHQYNLIPNTTTYKYKLIQIHPYKVVYCRHMSHSLPRVSESSNSSLHPMVQPCRVTTEKSMSADPSSALQDRHLDHMHDCRSLNHPPPPPNQVTQSLIAHADGWRNFWSNSSRCGWRT